MSTSNVSTLSLRSVLEREKLNGKNFLDWHRNLRIILKQEKKDYVFTSDLPAEEAPPTSASRAIRDAYAKHVSDLNDVLCLILATMEPDLQKMFEHLEDLNCLDLMAVLKDMFQEHARN